MASDRIRVGDIVTFRLNDARQADEVIARARCTKCRRILLLTYGRLRLNEDNLDMHRCPES